MTHEEKDPSDFLALLQQENDDTSLEPRSLEPSEQFEPPFRRMGLTPSMFAVQGVQGVQGDSRILKDLLQFERHRNELLTSENTRLKDQLQQERKAKGELLLKTNDMQAGIEELRETLSKEKSTSSKIHNGLLDQINKLKQENASLKRENTQLRRQVDQLQKKVDTFQSEIDGLKQQHRDQIKTNSELQDNQKQQAKELARLSQEKKEDLQIRLAYEAIVKMEEALGKALYSETSLKMAWFKYQDGKMGKEEAAAFKKFIDSHKITQDVVDFVIEFKDDRNINVHLSTGQKKGASKQLLRETFLTLCPENATQIDSVMSCLKEFPFSK